MQVQRFPDTDPPCVRVTHESGAAVEWPVDAFDADPTGCIIASGCVPVPQTISAPQARAVLRTTPHPTAGTMHDAVVALMASPELDPVVGDFWEYEYNLDRDSPALNAMAAALGLSGEAVDALFRAAAEVRR